MRYFIKCPFCKRIDPLNPDTAVPIVIVCASCDKKYFFEENYFTKEELGVEQMKLEDILSKSFKKPGGKTLKLEIAKDTTVANAVSDALEYLNHESNIEHNRIEFKYGRNYIVIAKLKDES